jgi:protein-tyrosine phosphatase
MAEGLLKKILKDDEKLAELKVLSAGTNVYFAESASKEAVQALKKMGIDIKSHKSRQITKKMLEETNLILTMTLLHKFKILSMSDEVSGKVYTLKEYVNNDNNNDILDPFGMPLDEYDKCAKEIYEELLKLKEKLTKGGE